MTICRGCKHAIWDYEEYFGGMKRWFVESCKKDLDEFYGDEDNDCEEYAEVDG